MKIRKRVVSGNGENLDPKKELRHIFSLKNMQRKKEEGESCWAGLYHDSESPNIEIHSFQVHLAFKKQKQKQKNAPKLHLNKIVGTCHILNALFIKDLMRIFL